MKKSRLTEIYSFACGAGAAGSRVGGELASPESSCESMRQDVGFEKKEMNRHTSLLLALRKGGEIQTD